MFKVLAICLSLFVASNCFTVGGYQPATMTDEFMTVARWTAGQMSSYTDVLGDHNLMTVRNLMTQVVNGINYKFTIDLLIQTPENQYFFRSCDLTVFDQPWTNTRQIVGTPQCGANPYFP